MSGQRSGPVNELRSELAARVRARIDAGVLATSPPAERRLRVREEALAELRERQAVLSVAHLTRLVNEISDEVVGLGPIEDRKSVV